MTKTYYNEIDPYAAQWLRNLIFAGHIAPGDVDERSISDVKSTDLNGYTQCHFFAGIGGWSYALRLAGWPDNRPVWTGSCPCQPFSSAGQQKGNADARHLFPVWLDLIRERRPPSIFGEQVANAIAHGWLDDVYSGLEAEDYAIGAAILPACGVGAPHKRDRCWFVANANDKRKQQSKRIKQKSRRRISNGSETIPDTASKGLFPSSQTGIYSGKTRSGTRDEQFERLCSAYADTNSQSSQWPAISWNKCDFWSAEPAVGRVANGIPARAHKLRAYGNAIVPQIAAQFIKACM